MSAFLLVRENAARLAHGCAGRKMIAKSSAGSAKMEVVMEDNLWLPRDSIVQASVHVNKGMITTISEMENIDH